MGIDVEMAVTIFLRRIAYDKRLPLDLIIPQVEHLDDQEAGNRSYTAIAKEMIDELWISFQRYMDGSDELGNLKVMVAQNTGMNENSTFIYLYFLANLMEGQPNSRVIKYKDFEYLMEKIRNEMDSPYYEKALESVRKSIPYWEENIAGHYAEKVKTYYEKNKGKQNEVVLD